MSRRPDSARHRRPLHPAGLSMVAVVALVAMAPGALAQGGDGATNAELRRMIEEMRRRIEQLEARAARPPAVVAAPPRARAPAPVQPSVQPDLEAARSAAREARAAATEAQAAQRGTVEARQAVTAETAEPLGLEPPALVGREFEDALRSDLPGIAFRVPRTETQVRLYGFAKTSAYVDVDGRNQTDAPLAGGIPLRGSAADLQGGDFGMTARFSRFGVDTRSVTSWGTLETRLEGDFGGGAPTSSNAVFRLRQAWAELGTDAFRVLAGQTNSLWNEGLFETLIDATNLNQSFIRQAQFRVSGRLARGLTGQVSIEAPETQYTSVNGVVGPGNSVLGGASPAFNTMPDLHGRLTYREDGLELGLRGMVRRLQIRTAGTAEEPPDVTRSAAGWGFAAHVRFPMRFLSNALDSDELLGMVYYGEGIGRYFASSTNGQDAVTNLGLPGVNGNVSLDAIPSWGVTAAYRRFWTPQVRSNVSYAYARQDFPGYALDFAPGSAAAAFLNTNVHQVFANLIWSPFGETRNGVFGAGWLDVGVEYLFTRRDLFGGAAQAGADGFGRGNANRFLFAAIARF